MEAVCPASRKTLYSAIDNEASEMGIGGSYRADGQDRSGAWMPSANPPPWVPSSSVPLQYKVCGLCKFLNKF